VALGDVGLPLLVAILTDDRERALPPLVEVGPIPRRLVDRVSHDGRNRDPTLPSDATNGGGLFLGELDLHPHHAIMIALAAVMRVRVRLFAGLRERAGSGERKLDLHEGARTADVWARLELGEEPPGLLYAVNQVYASRDTVLADGDEVALIPPVSGGAFRLTEEPIDVGAVIAEAAGEQAGAIAVFLGTVRRRSRGREVVRLEYDAYAGMAEKVMAEIADSLKKRYELGAVAITHRVGPVAIGETSVAIAVAAPHRGEALAACQEAIDTLKTEVPLWKKEVYEGGEEWIGRGS
jgi:molybdopterin synthase catalytic subunit/molybdopterin converting factor small subunit